MGSFSLEMGTYDSDRAQIARSDGSIVKLTPRENDLLSYLAENAHRSVSRQELLREVWRVAENTKTPIVDVTLHRLRGKLERDPGNPAHIRSIAGEGYRFFLHAETPAVPVKKLALPAERDEFVGRIQDLEELHRRLCGGARLITVTGMGGTGKTRFVTHYAWARAAEFPGGIWFCDLTEARDLYGIAGSLASVLQIPLADYPIEQLGHALQHRGACLVVLDNFEQVAEHAAASLGIWLDRASEASFVVTSRKVLGLPGEQVFGLDELSPSEAEHLFWLRAQAARREVESPPAERTAVTEIVKLLDYSPLAIELAAARTSILAPSKILEKMADRFRLLATDKGRPNRHSSLRGVLDWSWELLTAEERLALGQLSIFEGGFSLSDAELVVQLPQLWALDAVQALVQQSLVFQRENERFDLLVSVQEYARQRLSPEDLQHAQQRHLEHFSNLGSTEALDELEKAGGVFRQKYLVQNLPNLIAASRRAIELRQPKLAANATLAAIRALKTNGPMALALQLYAEALAITSPGTQEHARLQIAGADLHYRSGRVTEAPQILEEAIQTLLRLGDGKNAGWAHVSRARIHRRFANFSAVQADLDEAERLLQPEESANLQGILIYERAMLSARQAPTANTIAELERAIAYFRQSENTYGLIRALNDLANHCRRSGVLDGAMKYQTEALAIAKLSGDRHGHALVAGNWATGLAEQGRLDDAIPQFEQALADMREIGDRNNEAINLVNLGCCARDLRRWSDATHYFQQASQIFSELKERFTSAHLCYLQGSVEEEQQHWDAAEALFRQALLQAEQCNNRLVQGFCRAGLSRMALRQQQWEEADQAFATAERLLDDPGQTHPLARIRVLQAEAEHRWRKGGRAEEYLLQAANMPHGTPELDALIARVRQTIVQPPRG